MNPDRPSFLAILPFLALAGCAAPPQLDNPGSPGRESAALHELKQALQPGVERADAYAYVLSGNTECRATLTITWPESRRRQEEYAEAATILEFDWGKIAAASYRQAPEIQSPAAGAAISIGFSFPQPYETKARTRDGASYDAIGFFDGLDLDLNSDPASAGQALRAILDKKEACSKNRRDIATADADYSPEEQYQLGNAYLFSRHPGPKSVLAYQWYEKAARRGSMKAQLTMGNARRSGLHGVARNMAEARHWFELAAAQGSPHAQGMLGDMYEHGTGGLPRDPARAAAFYRSAAEQGLALEQEALADMLRFGKGIPKNVAEARVWYRKAAAGGSGSARDALVAMEKE